MTSQLSRHLASHPLGLSGLVAAVLVVTRNVRISIRFAESGRMVICVLAAVCASGCIPDLDPDPPQVDATPLPEPPVSAVQLPLSVPLERLRAVAEQQVPSHLAEQPWYRLEDGGPDAPSCGVGLGYNVDRDPLALSGASNAITTSLSLRYWIKARKRIPCPGPLIYVSCGVDNESARTLTTSFVTTLGIADDWQAKVNTTAGPVVPSNQCTMSFLNINMTDKVVSFFGNKLNEMVGKLNERAASEIRLRERATAAWARLQKPIRLADGVWLAIAPENIGYVPITANQAEITGGLQLRARPGIVVGAEPSTTTRPLPAATTVQPGNSFHVTLPVDVGYAAIDQQLRQALALDSGGTYFPPTGDKRIRIVGAQIYAYGRQAVLRLAFNGSAKGHAYLVGTPTYDALAQTLSFPDLDYSLETRNVLVKIADWFKHEDLRIYLRGRLRFDVAEPVGKARNQLVAAMNQNVGDVTLAGTVDGLMPLGLMANPEQGQFRAMLQANGTLSLRAN